MIYYLRRLQAIACAFITIPLAFVISIPIAIIIALSNTFYQIVKIAITKSGSRENRNAWFSLQTTFFIYKDPSVLEFAYVGITSLMFYVFWTINMFGILIPLTCWEESSYEKEIDSKIDSEIDSEIELTKIDLV